MKAKVLMGVAAIAMVFSGFTESLDPIRKINNTSFTTGEKLNYKVHYGFVNAAEGEIDIDDKVHSINGKPCYRINVYGKTTGSFDFFLRVRDTWRSYVDTSAIVPHRFFRNIEEGKYRKKETVDFDHSKLLAVHEKTEYKIPKNVQDIVSGFYYMRTLDLNKYKPGDPIKVTGFFDEETFEFDVTYKGREKVKTKFGYISTHRLVPQMPANKLFDGKEAISVYLSDDKNKIPILIRAEMFVGAVEIELTKYQGVRNPLNFTKR